MYLAGVDEARFRRTVVPGDQLRIEVQVLANRSRSSKIRAQATVDGALAAEAVLLSMLVHTDGGRP